MDFFKLIEEEVLSRRLQMLLIGGLAVNFYGRHAWKSAKFWAPRSAASVK